MRWLLLLILLTWGCNTPQVVTERNFRDSTIIREVPRIIEVPGSVIQSPSINLDSLVQLIKEGVKPSLISNTLIKEDPETKLRVGLLIDELGNLSALCEQQDRMIEILNREVSHWRKEYEKTTITKSVPWYRQIIDNIILVLVCLLIGFISNILFRLFL